MTERTQEQLDLIYEPLQQELRDAYMLYISIPYSGDESRMSYSEWLHFELAELNYEIAELQEQQ